MRIEEFTDADVNEKPLDRMVYDGGFCGIFRNIACVGDSLSSGEFEGTNAEGNKTYHDMFEYSWGQYLARMAGCSVRNFSRGGMTAKEYITSFGEEKGYWNPELACEAYIIALGVNDLSETSTLPVGSVDDICPEDYTKNKDTFAGQYAHIISRYKEIQPDAKFFLMTVPNHDRPDITSENEAKKDAMRKLLYDFADYFDNTYVLDIRKYGPVYDAEFRRRFFLGSHMNACGYLLTARIVASYIDYIIRHNYRDFSQVSFIGKPMKNTVDVD